MNFRKASLQDIIGTGYKGSIDVSKEALEKVFGSPDYANDTKTKYEWRLKFSDGTVVAIYDYKGFRWNIGGFTHKAVEHVYDALNMERDI